MIKYIDKIIIQKAINDKEYDIYPKTTADNVMYDNNTTVMEKIQELENEINTMNQNKTEDNQT